MSVIPIVAVVSIALLAAIFVANLVSAYRTQGGAIGQVPVMAMAVGAPTAGVLQLALFDRVADWPDWPVWGYVIVWLIIIPAASWATAYAGRMGTRNAANRPR